MSQSEPSFEEKSILVVEDDEMLREALVSEFEMLGFARVYAASNGEEAFRLIETVGDENSGDPRGRDRIDAVVSDIRMPGGDGVDLLRRIKDRCFATPVLMFVTGFTDLSVQEAYHLGAEAILSKPFELDALDQMVRKILTPKRIRWGLAPDCAQLRGQFEKTYVSLTEASRSGEFQLGRGGAFLQMSEGFLSPSQELIGLKIEFRSGPVSGIDGCATVRWSRPRPEGNLPPGVGVEFEHITPEQVQELDVWIERLKLRPYIPKC